MDQMEQDTIHRDKVNVFTSKAIRMKYGVNHLDVLEFQVNLKKQSDNFCLGKIPSNEAQKIAFEALDDSMKYEVTEIILGNDIFAYKQELDDSLRASYEEWERVFHDPTEKVTQAKIDPLFVHLVLLKENLKMYKEKAWEFNKLILDITSDPEYLKMRTGTSDDTTTDIQQSAEPQTKESPLPQSDVPQAPHPESLDISTETKKTLDMLAEKDKIVWSNRLSFYKLKSPFNDAKLELEYLITSKNVTYPILSNAESFLIENVKSKDGNSLKNSAKTNRYRTKPSKKKHK